MPMELKPKRSSPKLSPADMVSVLIATAIVSGVTVGFLLSDAFWR